MKVDKILSYVSSAVFPEKCVCCGRIIDHSGACRGCDALMPRTPKNGCRACGQAIGECECWRFDSKIDGFAAPFYNEGRGKNAMYNFKLNEAITASEYFAGYMVSVFRERFPDIEIDFVCCVPDAHRSRYKRGYYSANELAKAVAAIMDKPFRPNTIIQIRSNLPQHTLDMRSRIENVKGIYKVNADIKGKNVLVVDDIRTSGATLNECCKMLKKAKAKSAFALSAVLGRNLQ
ncbi:MAG: ComF family protein [Clostridia bacterium]|nr:ComF family protein [Clostridia bacterium]